MQSRGPSGPKRVTLGLHGDLSADEGRKQAAVVIDRIKRGEMRGMVRAVSLGDTRLDLSWPGSGS